MYFRRSLIAALFFVLLFSAQARAVETALRGSLGYGQDDSLSYSLDLEHSFEPFLQGEAYSLRLITNLGLFAWHNSSDDLWGGVAAAGLKFNFGGSETFRPYLAGSFGPALISQTHFDNRDLGCAFQFRSKGALGVMFGNSFQHSLEFSVAHYSHTRWIDTDNDGYTAYSIAYAYTF